MLIHSVHNLFFKKVFESRKCSNFKQHAWLKCLIGQNPIGNDIKWVKMMITMITAGPYAQNTFQTTVCGCAVKGTHCLM